MKLYKGLGSNFYRKKKMELVYKELKHFKETHKVEYNYFWADTFLGMSNKEFDEFIEMYQDINLPFWMQTRPETVTDYNMSKLKSVPRILFPSKPDSRACLIAIFSRSIANGYSARM